MCLSPYACWYVGINKFNVFFLIMEFKFNCDRVLGADTDGLSIIDGAFLKRNCKNAQATLIIDTLGQLSSKVTFFLWGLFRHKNLSQLLRLLSDSNLPTILCTHFQAKTKPSECSRWDLRSSFTETARARFSRLCHSVSWTFMCMKPYSEQDMER